jgi:putative ABC transport system substrate-binding protein
MRRRELILAVAGAAAPLLRWPSASRAQPRERPRRIGALMSIPATDPEARLRTAALGQGLRELGWVEGRNLRTDYRWGTGDAEVLRRNARELLALAPDLIVANSTPAALALKAQGGSVPVVFVQVTDPVGQGIVASLARPGGNLTGFTSFEFTIGTKWLETLKVVAPHVTRVALLFDPQTAPFAGEFVKPVEAAAAAFDATPVSAALHGGAEIERFLAAFAREPGGGLMVLPDVSTMNSRDLIITLAERYRLPAIYPFRYFAASGGLMSYGTDVADIFRRAAGYVDRILKGARASDLPVQVPSKLELVMNLKAAKALGITMPPLLLARADEVIE